MGASEAAGEKNWDMERIVRDTFHPPTTVVAAPDPTQIYAGTRWKQDILY